LSSTSHAVFISYASQDAEAAGRICEALRAAGVEVWFDRSELRGGDAWDQKIRREIRDCALFVPVISANTAARHEGYFRLEWDLADQRSHMIARNKAFIVPVCLDRTPESGADVPETFQRVQWTRLPDGKTPPEFAARIAAPIGISLTASGTASGPMAASEPACVETAESIPRRRLGVVVLIGVVAVVLAYVVVDRFWLSKHTAAGRSAPAVAHAPEAPTSAIVEKSIAVLPFVDMREKKDQEYFADGMAEEVLDQLVKVPQLKVISRAASFQYKGKTTDVRAIGADLGARYLVEGSVRKSGNKLRVAAELIDAEDGTRRWADRYDRDIDDVLKVQDDIAISVVRALEVTVDATELPTRAAVRVPAAYDAYLRGRHATDRFNQRGFEEALDEYREALRLDPTFARAAAALAYVQTNLAIWGGLPVDTAFREARASAQLAIRLDAALAMPHAILARTHVVYDWDWQAARDELAKATALQPRDPTTEWAAGELAMAEGNWDDAIRHYNASLALDPLVAAVHYQLSASLVRAGRLEEAEAAIRKAIQISPSYVWARYQLGNVLVLRGKLTDALAAFQEEPDPEAHLYGQALANFALGRRQESDTALKELTKLGAGDWAFGIATVHAYRREVDQAFIWLERAYAQKDVDLFTLNGDPMSAKLWPDPRYKLFLRKMNLPE
jgi:TolB-like protein